MERIQELQSQSKAMADKYGRRSDQAMVIWGQLYAAIHENLKHGDTTKDATNRKDNSNGALVR